MKFFLVDKFTCASCSSSYIGETCRHFKTRIEEHIKKDNKSHIFKHLHSTGTCFGWHNSACFKIIVKANSKFDLKIKEALHINWRKLNLNAQQNHLALTLCSFLSLFFFIYFFFFAFSFIYYFYYLWHVVSASFTVLVTLSYYFISLQHTFYYTLFFIYFFIISTLIIDIFYYLNYTSLLLYLIITHLVLDFIITI